MAITMNEFAVTLTTVVLTLFLEVFSFTAQAAVCDVDADGDVDRNDINAIFTSRNTPAGGPNDPRDVDGDGIITVLDGRSCVLHCNLSRCAIVAPNTPPVAKAGENQTGFPGDAITLDGSASGDADGDSLNFSWSLVSAPEGSQATLDDPSAERPDIVVDLAGDYILQLIVNDGTVDSTPDTVRLDISNPVYIFDPSVQQVQPLPTGGGTVALQDPSGNSYTLEVPSGAISADTEFTLTRVDSITGLPVGTTALAAVRLEPSGLGFAMEPSLKVELPPFVRSGKPAIAFLSDDNGDNLAFVRLNGTDPTAATLVDLIVSIRIPHFTTGGIVEVGADAVLPPPPPGANAETRANHIIALRIEEILGADPNASIVDDPIIFDALIDWFENPADGLSGRADRLATSPDVSDLTSLLDLNGEMNRLLLEVGDLLGEEEGGLGEIFEAAIVETMADLVAAYLVELRILCDTSTLDAQDRLNVLSVEVVDSFVSADLKTLFEDEVFACEYDVTFTPDFQAGFVGDLVDIDYFITLEDGSVFNGGIEGLRGRVSETIGANLLMIESISATTITVSSALFGLGNVTVQLGAGPEEMAEVLFVPSFIGDYGGSGSGSASRCSDPEDAGPGEGAEGISFVTEVLLAATRNSATIGVSGAGSIVTGIDLTVNLTDIDPNTATGTAFGGATYRLVETDDFGDVFVTVGSGSLDGTVTATTSGNTFLLDFDGGDNFCSTVTGTVLIASP
jgi:hypothetical protein